MDSANRNSETLGKLVQRRRGEQGLTMVALAAKAGVSPTALRRLEHDGRPHLRATKAARVLVVLGVDVRAIQASSADPQYVAEVVACMRQATRSKSATSVPFPGRDPDVLAWKNDEATVVTGDKEALPELTALLRTNGWKNYVPE